MLTSSSAVSEGEKRKVGRQLENVMGLEVTVKSERGKKKESGGTRLKRGRQGPCRRTWVVPKDGLCREQVQE